MSTFVNLWYSLNLLIDSMIYSFISLFFQLFIVISEANLFGAEELREITDKIFAIMGVVLLFYLSYEILTLIVNPDKLSSGSSGKTLVTKFISSIILLILLPTIFNYLHIFQNNVINSNIIGNIIVGSSANTNAEEYKNTVANKATVMALSIAQTFYHPEVNGVEYDEATCDLVVANPSDYDSDAVYVCNDFITASENAKKINRPGHFFRNDELKQNLYKKSFWYPSTWTKSTKESTMAYHFIMSTVGGVFALWMILSYCLDVGVRVAKLAFFEIIAPISIVQNIFKQESFLNSSWFQNYMKTYIDVFIRLITIFFSIEIIAKVPDLITNIFTVTSKGDISEANFIIRMLATAIIILGILKFAKDAPTLMKDLFGGAGGLNLLPGVRKRLEENEYARKGGAKLAAIGGGIGANAFAHFGNVGKLRESSKEEGISEEEKNDRRKLARSRAMHGVRGIGTGFFKGLANARNVNTWEEAKSATKAQYDKTSGKISDTDEAVLEEKERRRSLGVDGIKGTTPWIKVGLAKDEGKDLKERLWKNVKSKFQVDVASQKNPQIDEIINKLEELFNNFDSSFVKEADKLKEAAFKNYYEGTTGQGGATVEKEPEKVFYVKPKYGPAYAHKIPSEGSGPTNSKEIKEQFDQLKAERRASQYNDESFDNLRKAMSQSGEVFMGQLTKVLKNLSKQDNEVFFNKLSKYNISSTDDIAKIFKDIGSKNVSAEQMAGLDAVKSAMKDVIKSNYQINTSKPKSKE